jgi:hypothetical protein
MNVTPEEMLQMFSSKLKPETLQNILLITFCISFAFLSIFRIIQNVVVVQE